MNSSYNRKKEHLRQVSKENMAMMVRINNQKSSYQSFGKTVGVKGCKLSIGNNLSEKGQKKGMLMEWRGANK
jgi:stalled ribosome rescue protein Dom34